MLFTRTDRYVAGLHPCTWWTGEVTRRATPSDLPAFPPSNKFLNPSPPKPISAAPSSSTTPLNSAMPLRARDSSLSGPSPLGLEDPAGPSSFGAGVRDFAEQLRFPITMSPSDRPSVPPIRKPDVRLSADDVQGSIKSLYEHNELMLALAEWVKQGDVSSTQEARLGGRGTTKHNNARFTLKDMKSGHDRVPPSVTWLVENLELKDEVAWAAMKEQLKKSRRHRKKAKNVNPQSIAVDYTLLPAAKEKLKCREEYVH